MRRREVEGIGRWRVFFFSAGIYEELVAVISAKCIINGGPAGCTEKCWNSSCHWARSLLGRVISSPQGRSEHSAIDPPIDCSAYRLLPIKRNTNCHVPIDLSESGVSWTNWLFSSSLKRASWSIERRYRDERNLEENRWVSVATVSENIHV